MQTGSLNQAERCFNGEPVSRPGVMLFEQLAQFSSACSNVHRSVVVVPWRENTQASPCIQGIDSTLYSNILLKGVDLSDTLSWIKKQY